MLVRILRVKPFTPAEVGDKRYEFAVTMINTADEADATEWTVGVTAEELTTYQKFQTAVLIQAGEWVTFAVGEPQTDAELHMRWQEILELAPWKKETAVHFETSSEDDFGASDIKFAN